MLSHIDTQISGSKTPPPEADIQHPHETGFRHQSGEAGVGAVVGPAEGILRVPVRPPDRPEGGSQPVTASPARMLSANKSPGSMFPPAHIAIL